MDGQNRTARRSPVPARDPACETSQHPRAHDQVRRRDQGDVGEAQPPGLRPAANPHVHPGLPRSRPASGGSTRSSPRGSRLGHATTREVGRRVQQQHLRRLGLFDDELRRARGTIRNAVARAELPHPSGVETVGARPVVREQRPVDPPWGVPTRAVPPHLGQPRPHGLRRDRHGPGMVGAHVRPSYDAVAGQGPQPLRTRGSRTSTEPAAAPGSRAEQGPRPPAPRGES